MAEETEQDSKTVDQPYDQVSLQNGAFELNRGDEWAERVLPTKMAFGACEYCQVFHCALTELVDENRVENDHRILKSTAMLDRLILYLLASTRGQCKHLPL